MCSKHCGKSRKMLAISIFFFTFPTMLSFLSSNSFRRSLLNKRFFEWRSLMQGVCKSFTTKPVPNNPWFLHVCSTSLLKTLWEKEKLLVTSNFFFSHSVFYTFEKLPVTFIKSEIVVCKLLFSDLNAIFSHSVFYTFEEFPVTYIKFEIVVCKTLSVWKSLKFVVCGRVNSANRREGKSCFFINEPYRVNSSPNKKILDRSKLKAFADDKIK